MENLKQKSFKAFAWDFSGKVAGQFVSFIISVFLARLLTPEDFGLVAMVSVVIAFSGSLMDMGLGVALVQKKDATDAHYGAVFFFNLFVGTLLSTIMFFSAGFIARYYEREIIKELAQAMSLIFLINSFGYVIRIKLRKELQLALQVQSNVLGAILSGAIGISMAFMGYGVWSLVVQSLTSILFKNAYLFIRVKWRPKLKFSLSALKDLWKFGFRMFLSNFLDTIFTSLDTLIIGKIFSATTLGLYYRAKSFKSLITQYTSGSLTTVMFPVFSQVQDDLDRLRSVFFKAFYFLCFVTFFLVGLLYVVGQDLIVIIYSSRWDAAVPFYKILILSAFGYPINALLVNVVSGTGNSKAFLKLAIVIKLATAANFIVGFMFGIEGFLYGLVLVTSFGLIVNSYFSSKQLHINMFIILKGIFPYLLLSAVLMFSIDWILTYYISLGIFLHLAISSIVFALSYLSLAWYFNMKGFGIFFTEVKKIYPKLKIRK